MTQGQDHFFPYYRSAASIRGEVFTHRMRGLDEAEVREYLDLLADQVQAADTERSEIRAENERLRGELERRRSGESDLESIEEEINPQAVALFSQAQLVADQLVEEAVRHARELMHQARAQQREILNNAHEAAEIAAREAEEAQQQAASAASATSADAPPGAFAPPQPQQPPAGAEIVPMMPVAEVEYVRTFARVAQVQLRSVLDALAEQVDKLGEVPQSRPGASSQVSKQDGVSIAAWRTWQVDSQQMKPPDHGA